VLVVIEPLVPGSDSANKPLVVNYSSSMLGSGYRPEKVAQLVQ